MKKKRHSRKSGGGKHTARTFAATNPYRTSMGKHTSSSRSGSKPGSKPKSKVRVFSMGALPQGLGLFNNPIKVSPLNKPAAAAANKTENKKP